MLHTGQYYIQKQAPCLSLDRIGWASRNMQIREFTYPDLGVHDDANSFGLLQIQITWSDIHATGWNAKPYCTEGA
jgi:hypothetical protein